MTPVPARPADPRPASGPDVLLPSGELLRLRRHARRAYPQECCGVLLGEIGETIVVSSLHPTENRLTARRHDRYEIDPREILRLDRAAEESGRKIVGFYHSHPGSPAFPSGIDAGQAWPGYLYLIAGVPQAGRIEVTAWSYDDEHRPFRRHPLRVSRRPLRPDRGDACQEAHRQWLSR